MKLKNLPYYLVGSIFGLSLLAGLSLISSASICGGFQGCTGIGSATSTDVGKVLTVSSSTPYLLYNFSNITGITSLNGSTSSSQTFATSGQFISINTSNGVHTFTTPTIIPNLTLIGNILNTIQDIQTTSSPTFASGTYTGNINLSGYIKMTSSTMPTATSNDVIYLHAHSTNGIVQPHVHSVYTAYSCDDLIGDNCLTVKNNSGGNLTAGQVVYINGGSGANALVGLAQANATSTANAAGLVATTSVANNGFLFIVQSGDLQNVDTSAFAVGDTLYLSTSTAGGFTNVRPIYPFLVKRIGTVLRSNAINGVIDVNIGGAVLGQETGTISPTFNIGGSNALTTSSVSSYAITGLLAGTGISVASSSGVGTITNIGVQTITAGSNITVTSATGTPTIAVTSTPSFTTITSTATTTVASLSFSGDSTYLKSGYKIGGWNIMNASTTTSGGASSTVQQYFYLASTLKQIDCSTDGASITITMDSRATSTPQTSGTSVMSSLVCPSGGISTTTFANTLSANSLLNMSITSVANSTTTLRVAIKYQNN